METEIFTLKNNGGGGGVGGGGVVCVSNLRELANIFYLT